MARRGVATAFADIRADLSRFDADLAQARARLITAMRELDQLAVVTLRADTSGASSQLKAFQAEAQAAGGEAVVTVTADTAGAAEALTGVEDQAKTVAATDPTIIVRTEGADIVDADLLAIEAEVEALSASVAAVTVTANTEAAAAELAAIQADAEALSGSVANLIVTADTAEASAALAAVEAEVRALDGTPAVVDVTTVGADVAIADLAAVQTQAGDILGADVLAGLAAGATKISAIVAGLGVVIGGFALRATGQMEQILVGFKGVLGPVQGPNFLDQLKQFAAVTPLQLTQVTSAAQQLLGAFGPQAVNSVIPMLRTIGDIVSVTGGGAQQIDRVTLALTEMQGKGEVAQRQLNQLRTALPGFNAIQPIAQALGVTVPEAMKLTTKRAIDANTAIQAILDGMKQYPGAAGAMDRQSQTLIGRLSTLKDVARFAAIDGFGSLNTAAKTTLEGVISSFTSGALLTPFRTLSDALGNLFSTLVPAFINSLGPLSIGFAAIIGPLSDVLRTMIPAAVQLVPVLGELIGTLLKAIPLGFVQTIFDGLATGIAALNSVLQALGTTGTSALLLFGAAVVALSGGPLTALIAGITLLGVIIEGFNGGQREIQRNVDGVAAALGRQANAILTSKDAVKQLGAAAATTVEQMVALSVQQQLSTGANSDLTNAFGHLGLSMGQLVPVIEAIRRPGPLKVEQLFDPAAIAAFGQLGDKMGLTRDQLDALFKVAEKGDVQPFLNYKEGSTIFENLAGSVGLTVPQLSSLKDAAIAGGASFASQAQDVQTLVTSLDKLPVEKAIAEFLTQQAATLKSGQAFLTAAENGRTLEAATKDTSTAVGTLTEFMKLAGQAAAQADPKFVDVGEKLNNMTIVTLEAQKAAEGAATALSNLPTPVTRLAAEVKAANAEMGEFSKSLDLGQQQANFAKDSGIVAAEDAFAKLSTSASRAADEVSRVKSELDRIDGHKLDLTEAQTKLEKLLQTAKDFSGSSLDIQTGPGLTNVESLIDRIKAARDVAVATFDQTGDPAKAAAAYAESIARIGTQFVNAGGNLSDLNKKLSDLGELPAQFKLDITQASVDDAKKQLVENLAKISDTSPAVAVQIAAQIDKGSLGIAAAAFDALQRAPDKGPRVAEILATVTGADSAAKALDDLAKLTPAAKGGFNLGIADGIKNTGDLITKLKNAKDQALFVFGQTGDPAKATATYAELVNTIGQNFQLAGGNLDALKGKIKDLGAQPADFKVGLDEVSKTELLKEIEGIAQTNPTTAARLRIVLDQGDVAVVDAALTALQLAPDRAPRVARILATVDPFSADSVTTALNQLKDIIRIAEIGVEVTPGAIDTVLGDLAILDNNITPKVIPFVPDQALIAARASLDILTQDAIGVPLFPHGIFGNVKEAGGFVQAFKAGGRPLGQNIREAASSYTSGATPQWMWGEPSTHGEFFLSMAPQWRQRNMELHEQAGRMLYGSEYTVNARGLEAAVDKLAVVAHALTPQGQRRDRAEQGQRVLHMAQGAVVIKTDKPALAGRALIDELTARSM